MQIKRDPKRLQREGSFSLIETVIALGIITALIIEVSAVQGNSIVFSEYGRNITQSTWLAKRVLSQVEYMWQSKPFKELMTDQKNVPFDDFPEYQYDLEIKEWKFPIEKLLTMALGGGGKDDEGGEGGKKEDGGMGGMIETVMKQIFGDEPKMMTAHVEVSWPEGAQRNSVGLTYLLTNQAKLDAAIIALKPVWDQANKKPNATDKPNTTAPPGGGTAGTAGTAGGAAGGAAGAGTAGRTTGGTGTGTGGGTTAGGATGGTAGGGGGGGNNGGDPQ